MRKIWLIVLVVCAKWSLAQDPHFSQYFVAPQLVNPASFGVFNAFEAGFQYKGQWNSMTNGYTSMAAFANKAFKPQGKANSDRAYASAGINLIYDKAGDGKLTHFKAEIPLNVTKRVGRVGFLTGGINVGYGQMMLRNANFTWGNQFDGYQYNAALSSNEASSGLTRGYFDCAAGIAYTSFKKEKTVTEMSAPKNTFGLSLAHLNRPVYSLAGNPDERLRMRANFYEYHHIYLDNNLSLVPSLLVQYQGGAYEVVVGTFFRKMYRTDARFTGWKSSKYISLGFFYRVQDACALNLMLELKNYSLGLNYDFNFSKLSQSSHTLGGLELSLKMNDAFRYLYKGHGKY